jgi:hypothetical protein
MVYERVSTTINRPFGDPSRPRGAGVTPDVGGPVRLPNPESPNT